MSVTNSVDGKNRSSVGGGDGNNNGDGDNNRSKLMLSTHSGPSTMLNMLSNFHGFVFHSYNLIITLISR